MSEIKGAVVPFGIAIDYDDTFSTCPETWTKVIDVLREAGARVVCVTYRTPDREVTDFPGDVYYTSGVPKAEYMHDFERIKVWVDDMPELIGLSPAKIEARKMARSRARPRWR